MPERHWQEHENFLVPSDALEAKERGKKTLFLKSRKENMVEERHESVVSKFSFCLSNVFVCKYEGNSYTMTEVPVHLSNKTTYL